MPSNRKDFAVATLVLKTLGLAAGCRGSPENCDETYAQFLSTAPVSAVAPVWSTDIHVAAGQAIAHALRRHWVDDFREWRRSDWGREFLNQTRSAIKGRPDLLIVMEYFSNNEWTLGDRMACIYEVSNGKRTFRLWRERDLHNARLRLSADIPEYGLTKLKTAMVVVEDEHDGLDMSSAPSPVQGQAMAGYGAAFFTVVKPGMCLQFVHSQPSAREEEGGSWRDDNTHSPYERAGRFFGIVLELTKTLIAQ